MRLIVIGAGIIGMTSAYALTRRGHEVTVIDSAAGAGSVTSKANGAQLSYSFVSPLADPAVLPKLPGWLLQRDSPLYFRLRADPAQWRWALHFLKACRSSVAERTTAELLQLGAYSRSLTHELTQRENFQFDFKSSGKLLVYQNQPAYESALALMQYQAPLGTEQHAMTTAACVNFEPALQGIAHRIVGGIFTPSEDAGDCYALCHELHHHLEKERGVRFMFGAQVKKIRTQGQRVVALQTTSGPLDADGYVIANGVGAQTLCGQVGIDPLIYPLKGYSLTYELTEKSRAPHTSLSDVHNKVVYARLGNRLRVAGMVDIGATSDVADPDRIGTLESQVNDYLPELNPAAPPQAWAGLRPARPDSKPLIGPTPYTNLWVNVGHGALGFTMAAGSAGLLADRIEKSPAALSDALFQLRV